jgi:hypothetical protein
VACPFFMPKGRFDDGGWLHPSRLPLGAGWRGECWAPGQQGTEPNHDELRELCNLGYASSCSRLPQQRNFDAVRFSVASDSSQGVTICFVLESAHRPAGHGWLTYDHSLAQWIAGHPDRRIQRMAECYLESYLRRRVAPPTPAP